MVIIYTENRETEIALLKKMWSGEAVVCPKCGCGTLELLHKKAKKSNTEWKCPQCGEVFRTIRMLYECNE